MKLYATLPTIYVYLIFYETQKLASEIEIKYDLA